MMGRHVFKLPDLGEGAAEAEITAWHVAVGDAIARDDPLVDVMTDKATIEIPSPVAGTIVALHGKAGEKRAIGSELVEFEVEAGVRSTGPTTPDPPVAAAPGPALSRTAREGQSGSSPLSLSRGRGEKPSVSYHKPLSRIAGEGGEPRNLVRGEAGEGGAAAPPPIAPSVPAVATRPRGDKPTASPAVRGRAWDLGIALQFVPGSGPGGRITHADLDAYVAAAGRGAPARGLARRDGVEEVPLVGLRRAIAERLQAAHRQIPHFSYIEEVDVTALEDLRHDLNQGEAGSRPRVTVLPFLVRALVKALPEFPQINAHFDDDSGIVRRHASVHVGIATQTPSGLMVPVIFHAEARDLWDTAAELVRVAAAARDGSIKRDELTGSTITITSLGALGGIASTPVINRPEVAIVGVNKIAERPVIRDGAVAARKIMNLSSSFDHRVIDGWDAAALIQRIKRLLEQPALLFLD